MDNEKDSKNKGAALLMLLIVIIIGVVIYFTISFTIFKPDLLPKKPKTIVATEQKLIAKVEAIIKQGANINAVQNPKKQTLLHLAAGSGYVEAVQLLLDNNANVDARDLLNGTPLHRAVQKGHVNVVEILIKYGADIEARHKGGHTPLYMAINAKSNRIEVMSLLLSAGASVNVEVGLTGYSPLYSAINAGHLDAVELLIKHGADINFRNPVGGTPLHDAAYLGRPKIAELLIRHGADVNARAKSGETPLAVALGKPSPDISQEDRDKVAQVLQAHGGKE